MATAPQQIADMKTAIYEIAKNIKKLEKGLKLKCTCGNLMDPGDAFCSGCGTKVGEQAPPVPVAAAAPKKRGRPCKVKQEAHVKTENTQAEATPAEAANVKVKKEPEEQHEEHVPKRSKGGRPGKYEPPEEVRLGFVCGVKTLEDGMCLQCTREALGWGKIQPHDYTCKQSQQYCPYGRIPRSSYTVEEFSAVFGFSPTASGSHVGRGTPVSLP
jgi:hypothetical protein